MGDSGRLHRVPGLSMADVMLPLFTLAPAVFLIIYGVSIILMLGLINSAGLAPLFFGAFLILVFLAYQPLPGGVRRLPMIKGPTKGGDPYTYFAGGGEHVDKGQLCDLCGMEFGGERCNICGRTMCDTCWSKASPYQRCMDCLRCPICRSRTADNPCTLCGKIVCGECIRQGVCIECSSNRIRDLGEARREDYFKTVVMGPLKHMSDALCRSISELAKQAMVGTSLRLGDVVTVFDTPQRVIAVSPVSSEENAVNSNTVVSIVNRDERDARLRKIREKTGFPICFVEGCNFAIGRRCVSCSRFVCPNHSDFCTNCRKIVCQQCKKKGLCKFCYDVVVLGKNHPSITMTDISRLLRAYISAAFFIVFLAIYFYGETLDAINPLLRPAIVVLIIFIAPLYLLGRGLLNRKRRSGDEKGT